MDKFPRTRDMHFNFNQELQFWYLIRDNKTIEGYHIACETKGKSFLFISEWDNVIKL